MSPLSAETAAVWLKRNKESLGAVSVDSETGVCMTGLLLMADFSRAFQLPLRLSGPLNQGQREQAEATVLLMLLELIFLTNFKFIRLIHE